MQMYKIRFPSHMTRKEYIGISSKGARRRFTEHCSSKKEYPIVMAIKKYGKENAILEVIGEFDDYDEMYKAEKEAIKNHKTKAPNGYNLTDGGKGAYGLPASEERKRKISQANKGKKLSKETRMKISQANKGRDFSVQVKAMADATRGKKKTKKQIEATIKTWTGRKHTESAKLKMSISASKRKASEDTKNKISKALRIAMGDIEYSFVSPDGVVFKTKNLKAFCIENNLSKPHMYNIHNRKAKSHKGWTLSIS